MSSALRAVRWCTVVLALALVASLAWTASSSSIDTATPAVPAARNTASTRAKVGLTVATYNVKCANCPDTSREGGTWAQRRAAVVATIKGERPDVVGLQEASQGWLVSRGRKINLSQFEDLQRRVGGPYKLTNRKRNNCVNPATPRKCRYRRQGASQGTRILYNSARLKVFSSGADKLPSIDSTSNARYVAWAVFTDRKTGRRFFFADTQLEHRKDKAGSRRFYNLKKAQARAMVASIRRHNPRKLPAVVVGDLNSSRFFAPGNGPWDVLTAAGFVDPLGGASRITKTPKRATAEKRVNTWLNSFNGFARTAPGHQSWASGSHIDYIFTSKRMRVSRFEVVAHLDRSKRRFAGRIPSDHNMLTARVWV